MTMHKPACAIHVPMARPIEIIVPKPHIVDRVSARGPRLEWCARIKGIDPITKIDVLGVEAFRRAGLVAWAAPSSAVRLFVFEPRNSMPSVAFTGWRHEAWIVSPGRPKHLLRALYGDRYVASGDLVDALAQCEADAREVLASWMGDL